MNQEFEKQGLLFVFEGPDGCGKTTTIGKVAKTLLTDKRFKDEKVICLRDQTDHNDATKAIRELFHNHYSSLSAKARLLLQLASRAELDLLIDEYLDKGYIVLLDRYFPSTFVYQGIELDSEYINEVMEAVDMEELDDKYCKCNSIYILLRDKPFKEEQDDDIEKNTKFDEILQRYISLLLPIDKTPYKMINMSEEEDIIINTIVEDIGSAIDMRDLAYKFAQSIGTEEKF